jgi:hypothetical protein
MAPSWPTDSDLTPTNIYGMGRTMSVISTSSGLISTYSYYSYQRYEEFKKPETDKDKRDRISLEKLKASQKVYNDRTPTIKIIKQMCKPQHRLHAGAFRGLR